MASIIDSLREVTSDRFAVLKMLIFAIPVYYSYTIFVTDKGFSGNFNLVAGLTIFFLFALLIKVTNNVINERDHVLPSLNLLKLALTAIKGIAAIAIPTVISCLLVNYISAQIFIIPWVDNAIKTILWLVASSVIITSFLMFARNENILEAFNVKLLFEKAGDLILVVLFYVLQAIAINLVTTAFIGYAMYILLGFGPVFSFFLAFALVLNICLAGHYMGQVHYEALGAKDES